MDYTYYKHTAAMLRDEWNNTPITSPAKRLELAKAITAFEALARMH
jgi:hypothetical protein